jgi:hypothetical protein
MGASFAQNCVTPVSNNVYQQNYSLIASRPSEQMKLDQAIAFTATNCLTSNQVKLIALLFNTENSRLDFCKLSYHTVTDKENFYDVYDAFQQFSTAFKLHDFVLEQKGKYTGTPIPNPVPVTVPAPTVSLTFPNYNYPSYINYNGPTGCGTPLSEGEFLELAKTVDQQKGDNEKLIAASIIAAENCLSMAQAMKLASMLGGEVMANKFLFKSFEYIHDQGNYPSAKQCFTSSVIQGEWMVFCQEYLTPPCAVNDADFGSMLKKIDDASFADDQLNIVKALNSNHCFSTAQVRKIMDEFSFPQNKLDVAEILYPKCSDRENYYQLKGQFSFPTYESEFQDMISGN